MTRHLGEIPQSKNFFRPGYSHNVVRMLLTVVAFLLYFSYIPSYLYLIGYTSVNPGTVVAIFHIIAVLVWLLFDRGLPTRTTLTFAWCFFFVALNLLSVAIHGAGPDFYQRTAGAAAIVFLVVFCFPERISSRTIQWIILVFAGANLTCVAYDFYAPGLFVPPDSIFFNLGRGAGLFVNANKSGLAAVYVLILAAITERSKLLLAICLVCALWIAFTLSRTAILAYVLVCAVLILCRKLRLRDFVLPAAIAVVVAGASFAFYLIEQKEGAASIEERLDWFGSFGGAKDHASEERVTAARNALRHLSENPLFGHGFGSVADIYDLPPHNLYLTFGADYGLVGIIFVFLWFLVIGLDWKILGAKVALRGPLFAWIAATMFIALFFDEVLGINYVVFCLAALLHQLIRGAAESKGQYANRLVSSDAPFAPEARRQIRPHARSPNAS